jgi:hypothetical protein
MTSGGIKQSICLAALLALKVDGCSTIILYLRTSNPELSAAQFSDRCGFRGRGLNSARCRAFSAVVLPCESVLHPGHDRPRVAVQVVAQPEQAWEH